MALYRVRDNLYFSSLPTAQDENTLRKHHITHILSTIGPSNVKFQGITYGYVTLEDNPEQHLIPTAIEAEKWITKAIKENGIVLVNCHAGRSRSVSIVITYLILQEKLSYAEALRQVKFARADAQPNSGFVIELKDLSLIARRVNEISPCSIKI